MKAIDRRPMAGENSPCSSAALLWFRRDRELRNFAEEILVLQAWSRLRIDYDTECSQEDFARTLSGLSHVGNGGHIWFRSEELSVIRLNCMGRNTIIL